MKHVCVYIWRCTKHFLLFWYQCPSQEHEKWTLTVQSSCLARCWGGSCLCLLAFLKWLHGALQRKLLPRQAALNQRGCGLPKATKTDTRPKQILGPNFVPRSFDSQLRESTWRRTGKEVKARKLNCVHLSRLCSILDVSDVSLPERLSFVFESMGQTSKTTNGQMQALRS